MANSQAGILKAVSSGAQMQAPKGRQSVVSSVSSAVSGGGHPLSGMTFTLVIAGMLLLVILIAAFVLVMQLRRKANKEAGTKPGKLLGAAAQEQTHCAKITPRHVIIGNSQNVGKRKNQQDSFAVSDISNEAVCKANGVFSVVADGMGGLENGAQISSLAVATMLAEFEKDTGVPDRAQKLREMLYTANDRVNRYIQSHGNIQSGSTVVAVIAREGSLYWVSVGDSGIFLCRDKKLWQLNRPHNLGSELDEQMLKGEITREQAAGDPQRNALTSYLGIGNLTLVDANTTAFPLYTGDKLLLCSDGVFGTITQDEITQALLLPPHQAAEEIERLVLEKGRQHQDNMTAVVLEFIE